MRTNEARLTTVPMSFVLSLLSGTPLNAEARAESLSRAGIAPALLEAGTARVTTDQFANLYQLLARQLDDELPGLFSRPVRTGAFKFLCLSLLDAKNLQTALFRLTRFLHLLVDDFAAEMSRNEDIFCIALIPRGEEMQGNAFGQEILFKLIHGVSSWLSGQHIGLFRVDCSYPPPPHASEYRFLFPGPAHFEQPVSALYFEASQLAVPIRQDRKSLTRFLARAPGDWLFVAFDNQPTSQLVREHLKRRLNRAVAAPDVARALHLSLRTLTRRLNEEGTSFQALKDELRRDLAIQLLTKTDTAIGLIGQEIGFQDSNTFYRAFRQWTGSTPGAYRLSTAPPLPKATSR